MPRIYAPPVSRKLVFVPLLVEQVHEPVVPATVETETEVEIPHSATYHSTAPTGWVVSVLKIMRPNLHDRPQECQSQPAYRDLNPPEELIVTEVPELRIVDDALWQAVKARQGELTEKYANVIDAVRNANANRLNGVRRPRHLLSGLLECRVCGGPYAMRGQDRYGCSNHVMTGSCANGRGIARTVLEERVLAGLRDRLMAPEEAAEAIRAYRGNQPAQPRTPCTRRERPEGAGRC